MKQKKMWRYYCEHCGKGGCGKGAMAKHERRCVKNPWRDCGMCKLLELPQEPMPALITALVDGGITALRAKSDGCPVCMLSAIVQAKRDGLFDGEDDDFDYRTEMDQQMSVVRANQREWNGCA